MFYIVFFYLVPVSVSFTYNGINSTSTIRLHNINISTMSFDLQTRQHESFLFACVESSTQYFVAGIKDGTLALYANLSGNIIALQGRGTVNDGRRHHITIEYSNNNTSIINNNRTRIYNVNILNNDWMKLLTNRSLVIGSHDLPFIKDMFNNFYFGALMIKRIGGQELVENDYNGTDVRHGWYSSNPCDVHPCARGTCVDIFNAYTCECPPFYTNKHCNETVNVTCSFGSLCNNGICVNLTETTSVAKTVSDHGKDYFQCKCSPGFEGYLCTQETNECIPNNCKNGGTCVDGHLQYTCVCVAGWSGPNCTVNINECVPNPCMNKGICKDRINDYQCECFDGRYDGKNCTEDVDECTRRVDPCHSKGNCTNTIGDFVCACEHGFYGENCQYNNSAYCIHASPCLNGGNCSVNGRGYLCKCEQGFTGQHCDEIDYNECEHLKPCANNATCNDSHTNRNQIFVPGYTCTCTARFEGVNCTVKKHPCETHPCKNGGTCYNVTADTYSCGCTPQFYGRNCLHLRSARGNNDDIIVVVVSIAVVIVILIVAILFIICYFKKHSGQQGTYKPNAEEQNVGAVALEQIKKPNVERLI